METCWNCVERKNFQLESYDLLSLKHWILADSDLVEKLCHRITCVLQNELKKQQPSKKLKKANGEPAPSPPKSNEPPTPLLLSAGVPVDVAISIEDALKLSQLTLQVK